MDSRDDAVNETTPLVHDGVMFLWNFGETIQALDAKTGTLLWKFTWDLPDDYPSLPGFYRTKRSLAIGGDKLIVGTIDMHVIALDIKTGKKVWDVVTDDYKSRAHLQQRPAGREGQGADRRRQLRAGQRQSARVKRWHSIPRRADASSPATISRPARNCGGSTRRAP